MTIFHKWIKFSQVSDPGPSWPSCLEGVALWCNGDTLDFWPRVAGLIPLFTSHSDDTLNQGQNLHMASWSCEKGPSAICKKCRPRPAAASPTQQMIRVLHFLILVTLILLAVQTIWLRIGVLNIVQGLICVYTTWNVRMSLFAWRWPKMYLYLLFILYCSS